MGAQGEAGKRGHGETGKGGPMKNGGRTTDQGQLTTDNRQGTTERREGRMQRSAVIVLFVMVGIGVWPAGAMGQALRPGSGQASGVLAPPAASLPEDEATAKWKRAVNARLDEMVKEAERTGSPRIRELARQIRETVSKVRKIENGGNGG